jgi:predicted flavoprotein YhiN
MAMDQGQDVPDLEISWIQDKDEKTWERMLQQPSDFGLSSKQKLSSALNRAGIPARLSKALCAESSIPEDRILAELRKEERISIIKNLTAYKLHITGHEGFPKAEVTAGGVPLSEIDCGSMESRIHPGLYVIGELLDVFGRIGGFNFLLAWSTGRLAGKSAAQSLFL